MSLFATVSKMLRHIVFGHASHLKLHVGLKKLIKSELARAPKPILNEIHKEAFKIKIRNKHHIKDHVSMAHLEFVSKVLAAYQVLLPIINDKEQTINFVKRSVMLGYDTRSLRWPLAAMLYACRNRTARLQKTFSWLMRQYGTSFYWQSKASDDNRDFTLTISKCFYCEFFKSYDLRELTPILCQLDGIWFEQINPEKHGFKFDKANYQTQGYGAETCIFPIISIDKFSV